MNMAIKRVVLVLVLAGLLAGVAQVASAVPLIDPNATPVEEEQGQTKAVVKTATVHAFLKEVDPLVLNWTTKYDLKRTSLDTNLRLSVTPQAALLLPNQRENDPTSYTLAVAFADFTKGSYNCELTSARSAVRELDLRDDVTAELTDQGYRISYGPIVGQLRADALFVDGLSVEIACTPKN